MAEFEIKVGLKTEGFPDLQNQGEITILSNMLIGDGFHWQKTIPVILPGKIDIRESLAGKIESPVNKPENDDHIILINTLPLETYLECVVGSEMNPAAPKAFLKAHAIISRTWAAGKILGRHPYGSEGQQFSKHSIIGWDDTGSHYDFDVCSDDHCQRYQGLQSINPETLKALRETRGLILKTPEGELVDARFSKCCGGTTEVFSTCWQPIDSPCLESFKDPWCDLSSLSSTGRRSLLAMVLKEYDLDTPGYGFSWQVHLSKREIKTYLKDSFRKDIGDITRLEPLHRGPSGRIERLRVHGSDSYIDIGKELWIRRILSPGHLYSSNFQIEDQGENILLRGRGWGHGVGLCQIGAANMAMQGHDYEEILNFYYPGSIIARLY